MQQIWQQDKSEVQESAVAARSPFHLPDAASAMQGALEAALDYAARKLNLMGAAASLDRVRKGDRRAVEYCHYRLAQLVAEALGALDPTVQSVSLYEPEATPEDRAMGEYTESLPIHLIVWVDRKTNTFTTLGAALNRALTKDYAQMIGPRRLGHVLDLHVIDADDVESRCGAAFLLDSLYNRPIRLWQR